MHAAATAFKRTADLVQIMRHILHVCVKGDVSCLYIYPHVDCAVLLC